MKCKECGVDFIGKRKEQIYCSKSCSSVRKGKMRLGQKTGQRKGWKYSRQIDKDGYFRVYGLLHPYSQGRLLIPEHVIVIELHIRRRLNPDECVHHLNGDKKDNRLENLKLMKKSDHSRLHNKTQTRERDSKGRYA